MEKGLPSHPFIVIVSNSEFMATCMNQASLVFRDRCCPHKSSWFIIPISKQWMVKLESEYNQSTLGQICRVVIVRIFTSAHVLKSRKSKVPYYHDREDVFEINLQAELKCIESWLRQFVVQ